MKLQTQEQYLIAIDNWNSYVKQGEDYIKTYKGIAAFMVTKGINIVSHASEHKKIAQDRLKELKTQQK